MWPATQSEGKCQALYGSRGLGLAAAAGGFNNRLFCACRHIAMPWP